MGVLKMKVGGLWVPVSQGWSPLAGGIVGIGRQTAQQTGIGATPTDVTGCSVTFTAQAARTYRTTAWVVTRQSAVAGEHYAVIADAINTNLKSAAFTVPASGAATPHIELIETGLTGTNTRKLRVNGTAGTLNTNLPPYDAFIVVEDITAVAPDLGSNPLPTGWIGHATQTADQVVGTGLTDLPGLSVGPFTIPSANRKILATATVVASQAVAAATVQASIQSTPAGGQGAVVQMQIGDQTVIAWQWVLTNVSGAYTIKVQGSASAGTCTFKSSSGLRSHLVVQDIGG